MIQFGKVYEKVSAAQCLTSLLLEMVKLLWLINFSRSFIIFLEILHTRNISANGIDYRKRTIHDFPDVLIWFIYFVNKFQTICLKNQDDGIFKLSRGNNF